MRVLVLTLVVCLAFEAAAFVRRGDVVVTQPGRLVRLDPATGVTIEIPTELPLRRPTGVVVLPDGELLIADWGLPRINFGSVVRVRALDGVTRIVAESPQLVNPFALARSPAGRILLADIDAGEHVYLMNVLLRRGALLDFDADTGEQRVVVGDCCTFNPVAIDFASPTTVVAADAGCCAYSGAGQVVVADLVSGRWWLPPTYMPWRDPFAVAVDGSTAYVAESSVAQAGPAGVFAVDLGGGLTTRVAEGLPMVTPTGMILEDARHLLVADEGADAVFRVDVADGRVTPVTSGPPLQEPTSLVRIDVGDDVSGVTPSVPAIRACAEQAADVAILLARRVLRCVGAADPYRCLRSVRRRWPPSRAVQVNCPGCMTTNHLRSLHAIAEALLRTPGQHLGCTGTLPADRAGMARAAARLYERRSRCDGTYLAEGDRPALERCRHAADLRFVRAGRLRCDAAALGRIAAEVASVADAAIGLAYCAP